MGSSSFVSLALFRAFCVQAEISGVDMVHPLVFMGLLFGVTLPYPSAAMTMKSVGRAANVMVNECMKQFPKITMARHSLFVIGTF